MKNVNLAYYQEDDWDRFLELVDDREKMHDTWKEWHQAYLKTKKDLVSQGFIVKDFPVDLYKLKLYCSFRRLKIDGKARSQFVSSSMLDLPDS